jgi:predicted thioesterase
VRQGLSAGIEFEVTAGDTAQALLSGALEVLGTPRLVAWLEAATCAAVRDALDAGQTTVGTRVAVDHLAPSPVGAAVRVTATLVGVDGRMLTFDVAAVDIATGDRIARGTISRAVVDVERFLARVRSTS